MRVNDLHPKYRALGLTDAQISSMTIRQLHEFEHGKGCRVEMGNAQEGAEMATKNTTATTTTKENAMTITMPEKKYVKLADKIQLHNDWYAIVNAADPTPTDPVVNCCPGKTIANLTTDPVEQEFLRYVCGFFGWSNELCTVSQAKDNGGTLKDGAQGWPAVWKPQTTKAGKTSTFCTFVYPKEAFDWKDGAPAFDEEKKLRDAVEKAKKNLEKAEKELDKFLNPEKYAKKPRTTKAQLQAQNDALIAALMAAGIDPKTLVA